MSEDLRTKEKMSIRLRKHSGLDWFDFEIDAEGDLYMEGPNGEVLGFIAGSELPALRDWLNKVLTK